MTIEHAPRVRKFWSRNKSPRVEIINPVARQNAYDLFIHQLGEADAELKHDVRLALTPSSLRALPQHIHRGRKSMTRAQQLRRPHQPKTR